MLALDDTLLMAFADGELDAAMAKEVMASIAHDEDAQDKVRQFRRSTQLVRAVFEQPHFRAAMPARRVSLLSRAMPRPSSWSSHSLMAASLALFLLGMGAGGGLTMVRSGPSFGDRLLDEVADYHTLYAREAEHQVEVPAIRLAHIESWLGNRLHRKLTVPDLSAHGLTFVGARLLGVDGTPVAQLLYQAPGREHEPVAFCIAPEMGADEAARGEVYAGMQEVTWNRSGYRYVLAGWETRDFLFSLATELAPRLQQSL
jgi:anti-sigma factor RsiW